MDLEDYNTMKNTKDAMMNKSRESKQKLRARIIQIPLTKPQQLKIYFMSVWKQIRTFPPKQYTQTEIVKPGAEGYDDCGLEVGYTDVGLVYTDKEMKR